MGQGNAMIAPGAAAPNLIASGRAGIDSGATVPAVDAHNSALKAAGHGKIGGLEGTTTEEWYDGSLNLFPLSERGNSTAGWTESEMIVWSGIG